jgi:hypothetical protein
MIQQFFRQNIQSQSGRWMLVSFANAYKLLGFLVDTIQLMEQLQSLFQMYTV